MLHKVTIHRVHKKKVKIKIHNIKDLLTYKILDSLIMLSNNFLILFLAIALSLETVTCLETSTLLHMEPKAAIKVALNLNSLMVLKQLCQTKTLMVVHSGTKNLNHHK